MHPGDLLRTGQPRGPELQGGEPVLLEVLQRPRQPERGLRVPAPRLVLEEQGVGEDQDGRGHGAEGGDCSAPRCTRPFRSNDCSPAGAGRVQSRSIRGAVAPTTRAAQRAVRRLQPLAPGRARGHLAVRLLRRQPARRHPSWRRGGRHQPAPAHPLAGHARGLGGLRGAALGPGPARPDPPAGADPRGCSADERGRPHPDRHPRRERRARRPRRGPEPHRAGAPGHALPGPRRERGGGRGHRPALPLGRPGELRRHHHPVPGRRDQPLHGRGGGHAPGGRGERGGAPAHGRGEHARIVEIARRTRRSPRAWSRWRPASRRPPPPSTR